MELEQARSLVLKSLSVILKTDIDELDGSINLIDAGILDSLDAMSFLFQIEKSLGKKIFGAVQVDQELFELDKLIGLIMRHQ